MPLTPAKGSYPPPQTEEPRVPNMIAIMEVSHAVPNPEDSADPAEAGQEAHQGREEHDVGHRGLSYALVDLSRAAASRRRGGDRGVR